MAKTAKQCKEIAAVQLTQKISSGPHHLAVVREKQQIQEEKDIKECLDSNSAYQIKTIEAIHALSDCDLGGALMAEGALKRTLISLTDEKAKLTAAPKDEHIRQRSPTGTCINVLIN